MATIAAIKAVLLDKETNKKDTKSHSRPTTSSKPSKPVSAPTTTTSSKKSSSAQSLADAITNARKSGTSKSTSLPKKSPAKKSAKKDVEVVEKNSLDVNIVFTDNRVKRMSKEFAKKNVLTKEENRALALEVRLTNEQVKRWFASRRRRNVRTSISKQEKEEKAIKSHGLKSVEVSALLPMADIMSLSKTETEPEVVDILDDSLESEDDDVSLLETSKIVVTTPKNIEEKPPSKPIVKSSKFEANRGSLKETRKEKEISKEKVSKPDAKKGKPCTREEDLVEELLRRIEELEEDLKDKDGDLYYTKKDLESVQATLEGKERVFNTVQESIPKVVSEHKKALQTKDDEIKELKLNNAKLQKKVEVKPKIDIADEEISKLKKRNAKLEEEKKNIEVAKDHEIKELELSYAQLKKEFEVKPKLHLTDEVSKLKQINAKLEKEKNHIEVDFVEKFKAKEKEIDGLKLCNDDLKKENYEKLELERSHLKEHDEEIKQFKDTVAKCDKRIENFVHDLGKRDDEIKIFKYKERQACDNQVKVEETKRMLEENRKDTLALKDYERKLTRKITNLEFDLYTKTAESETQSLVISRLNEKIQSLQQQSIKIQKVSNEDLDISATLKYGKVLDDGLRVLENYDLTNTVDDDSVSEADRSLIIGLPQTSPYVVNTRSRRRQNKDDSTTASDDELDYSEDSTAEEPEFESLCAEIETLCVPPKRPLPFFSSPTHSKKMKMSSDILDIDIDIASSEAVESCQKIAHFIMETLLERIFEN